MFALLRFGVFALALVFGGVVFGAPLLAQPLLEQKVRDLGLVSDKLDVTIDALDPSLLTGHAAHVRVQASNVDMAPATVGSLDLTFSDVSLSDHSFSAVDGQMDNVTLHAGGLSLSVDSVDVDGPSQAANATGRLSQAQTEALIKQAALHAGITLDQVTLVNGHYLLRSGKVTIRATLSVRGGALVLEPDNGPTIVLLQPVPSDPWQLSEAWLTGDNLNVRGVIDANRLAAQLGSGR